MSAAAPVPMTDAATESKSTTTTTRRTYPLYPCYQDNENWLGLAVPAPVDQATFINNLDIRSADILEVPVPHITLAYGFKDGQYDIARKMVEEARLTKDDVVYTNTVYKVSPEHATTDYWCLDVDVEQSSKLVALHESIQALLPKPKEGERKIPLHVTVVEVIRKLDSVGSDERASKRPRVDPANSNSNMPPSLSTYVNYTPHPITVMDPEKKVPIIDRLKSSGSMRTGSFPQKTMFLVPYGEGVITMVEPQVSNGTFEQVPRGYHVDQNVIVSDIMAESLIKMGKHRGYIITPATGPQFAVRDGSGGIIGVKALCIQQLPRK